MDAAVKELADKFFAHLEVNFQLWQIESNFDVEYSLENCIELAEIAIKVEAMPEHTSDTGISEAYFQRLYGLFKLARENDFLTFVETLKTHNISVTL